MACCVSRLEHHGSHSCPVQQDAVAQSPSLSLSLSVPGVLTGVRQRAAAAAGDTLKSHEICRAALSPRSLHTSGWESYIRVGKKLTRPRPRSHVSLSFSLSSSPSALLSRFLFLVGTEETSILTRSAFREIFRRSFCRAPATKGILPLSPRREAIDGTPAPSTNVCIMESRRSKRGEFRLAIG